MRYSWTFIRRDFHILSVLISIIGWEICAKKTRLPTDRLTVKNNVGGITSLNAADDNDLALSFKVDAPEVLKNNPTVQRMETINLDVYGAKIEGKSEKQVQYAQDIRAKTVFRAVNSAWTDYKRTYDNAKVIF